MDCKISYTPPYHRKAILGFQITNSKNISKYIVFIVLMKCPEKDRSNRKIAATETSFVRQKIRSPKHKI